MTLGKTKYSVKYVLYGVKRKLKTLSWQRSWVSISGLQLCPQEMISIIRCQMPQTQLWTLFFLCASYMQINFYKTVGVLYRFCFHIPWKQIKHFDSLNWLKNTIIADLEKSLVEDSWLWPVKFRSSDRVIVILYRTLFARNFAFSVNGTLFFSELTWYDGHPPLLA